MWSYGKKNWLQGLWEIKCNLMGKKCYAKIKWVNKNEAALTLGPKTQAYRFIPLPSLDNWLVTSALDAVSTTTKFKNLLSKMVSEVFKIIPEKDINTVFGYTHLCLKMNHTGWHPLCSLANFQPKFQLSVPNQLHELVVEM